MATYNGGRYLREQLRSFVLQTTRPHELIVVDDGSNDDTLEIVRDFARTAPFKVQVFQNAKTLGVSKNFELALRKCRGDVIFLSDQDDVWLPEKISTVLQYTSSESTMYGVINNAFIANHSLNPLRETTFGLKSKHGRSAWYTGGIGCCLAISAKARDLGRVDKVDSQIT